MKIGIIVYSKTNNTNLIATQLNNQLKEKGYDSIVLQVVGVDDDPRFLKKVRLKTAPMFLLLMYLSLHHQYTRFTYHL